MRTNEQKNTKTRMKKNKIFLKKVFPQITLISLIKKWVMTLKNNSP